MAKKSNLELVGKGLRIGIVISRFNDFISKRLLKGCLQELRKAGVKDSDITQLWVPGSFEIPVIARKLASKKTVDVVVCLGAVIKGETYHFELVAQAASEGIMRASLDTGKPIIFGVLSTITVDQAYKRSDDSNNKGNEAGLAAIEMARLFKKI